MFVYPPYFGLVILFQSLISRRALKYPLIATRRTGLGMGSRLSTRVCSDGFVSVDFLTKRVLTVSM